MVFNISCYYLYCLNENSGNKLNQFDEMILKT